MKIKKIEKIKNSDNKKYTKKEILKIIILLVVSIVSFVIYLDFLTYKGNFKGEKILYVKMDGRNGSVLKINNKYTKDQYNIKNSKRLDYGYYLIKFKIEKMKDNNGFKMFEGKIMAYNKSKLNFMRKYILNIFDELFIGEDNLYAFSKASILGEKADLSKNLNDKFKYTGLAHLIVISGSHISLIIIWIVKILDSINLSYKLKYICSLIILTLYCTLVGMSPGIMRAYITGALMILARILFEQEDSKKSLFISLIIILVLNPYSIYDISLQLSYCAVVSIIFIYPIIEKKFKNNIENIKNEIVRETLKLLLLSLVIQIVSTPLFLYYFQKLPLFSFLLNVVGVPLGTVLIELLFGATILNILKITIFNKIILIICKYVYDAFEGFVNLGNKIPLLQANTNMKINIYFVVGYYVIFIILLKKIKELNKN